MAPIYNSKSRLGKAFAAGRRRARRYDWRPCIDCIAAIRGCSKKEATAYASGHFAGVRARGRWPETRCDCVLNSPFKS
jgi:hypothetical protein